jgi:hypothetical protein
MRPQPRHIRGGTHWGVVLDKVGAQQHRDILNTDVIFDGNGLAREKATSLLRVFDVTFPGPSSEQIVLRLWEMYMLPWKPFRVYWWDIVCMGQFDVR